MADSLKKGDLDVRIVDPTSQVVARVSASNEVGVTDTLDTSAVYGAIVVTGAATHVKVGGSNLTDRKSVFIYNNGTQTLYWGFDNLVTTNTGMPLKQGEYVSIDVGENVDVYLIAFSGSHNVRITEAA